MTFEPVKPTLAVATEAYQVLLELSRQHPEDVELANHREEARHMMHEIWAEREHTKALAL